MAKLDPTILAHLEWLGFVRPTGLVVSALALVRRGVILNRHDAEGQRLLESCVVEKDERAFLPDFRAFAERVLGWSFDPEFIAGGPEVGGHPIPDDLVHPLPDYHETLRPDFAVRDPDSTPDDPQWQLLVRVLPSNDGEPLDFDANEPTTGHLEASPHSRMERLLRQTQVTAGLLFNGRVVRLIAAPRGESAGWIDFRLDEMRPTVGRSICSALRLLLGEHRLLSVGRDERLPALLTESRKYQNAVSERLAEQVLHALYELLRGLQRANDSATTDNSGGSLLRDTLNDHPDEVYRALLTVILRLVFLLYAEERDMLPQDEVFVRHYSLARLHQRLREDIALHPDTMDQRYGAWAQLLTLFRLLHDGVKAGAMHLPARRGVLFDPDRFPFLEGRPRGSVRQVDQRIRPPLIADGAIARVLEKLLVLNGERISYRALDVEQIGSVYETMMGFRLETASGRSIAIRAQKPHGAPTTVDLEALLAEAPAKRQKWLEERGGRKAPAGVVRAMKEATTLEDLHAAMKPIVDDAATPDLVPMAAMILQPSEERRRSGSHYTPRALTKPIVETTLAPILKRLRDEASGVPKPDAILDLKVCDPAMGSGAFLVEACRQLGDALVESWRAHDCLPTIPPDEDDYVYARRMVAQRCLYGVDRNPVAVDLAKVSLWLVTLARAHAFTFLDHALRHGDSLVGLSRKQISRFHWPDDAKEFQGGFERLRMAEAIAEATALRERIRTAPDGTPDRELRTMWEDAEHALETLRLAGDLVVSAFFEGSKPREREQRRGVYADEFRTTGAASHRHRLLPQRTAEPPLAPFHWEIEFPEVFDRKNPGFDAFVGNPPFGGHVTVVAGNLVGYTDWLRDRHAESSGKCDVVAHFFRRAFDLLRRDGVLGLIATNTIAQGDTRASGLRWICNHDGDIFAVRRRVKWPGTAAVVVSVAHVAKGAVDSPKTIDGTAVPTITAFLFHRGGHESPKRLVANSGKSFQGSIVLGMGFTFDDTDSKGVATPTSEIDRIVAANPEASKIIMPYIGGEEANSSPAHLAHRFVISFGERSETECRRRWPELMTIVEQKVRPEREAAAKRSKSSHGDRVGVWWQHYHQAKDMYAAIAQSTRVLAVSYVGQHCGFVLLPKNMVYAGTLIVFPFDTHAAFCALQSRPHEIWARFFGSSMKDDLRYTPSDCFETFPFPDHWESDPKLEAVGQAYYDFRAKLMVDNDEGLTKTYNRFHDPEERDPRILKLRELHAAMDRAVLDAYGWSDISTDCEFILDYDDGDYDETDATASRRKKPWRYRWPDEIRDEVLARLLELNAQRAAEEARTGAAAEAQAIKRAKARAKGKGRAKDGSGDAGLFR